MTLRLRILYIFVLMEMATGRPLQCCTLLGPGPGSNRVRLSPVTIEQCGSRSPGLSSKGPFIAEDKTGTRSLGPRIPVPVTLEVGHGLVEEMRASKVTWPRFSILTTLVSSFSLGDFGSWLPVALSDDQIFERK